jgi:hypothetical protein
MTPETSNDWKQAMPETARDGASPAPPRWRCDARPALLALVFLALYFFSSLGRVGPHDFALYPFGADVPYYLEAFDTPGHVKASALLKHVTTVHLIFFWRWLLHSNGGVTAIKLLFAIIGGANIAAAYGIARRFAAPARAMTWAACYGVTGAVWYFASVPESYIVTTLLTTLYLFFAMRWTGSRRWPDLLAMTVVLAAGTLNEIIFPLTAVIPAAMLAGAAMKNGRVDSHGGKSLALFFAHGLVAGAVCLLTLAPIAAGVAAKHRHAEKMSFGAGVQSLLQFYRDDHDLERSIYEKSGQQQITLRHLYGSVLNLTLFPVCFPDRHAQTADPLFPGYRGYFRPGLSAFKKNPAGLAAALILIALAVPSLPKILREHTALAAGLLAWLAARFLLFATYNPVETILYAAPAVLPLLLLATHDGLAGPRRKTLIALAVCTALANAPFFIA